MKTTVKTNETREAILDATDKLLARFGYKKMTIDDIANEVGIGKGSVYLHFRSKEEIALSHVDRIIERLCVRLSKIADGESDVKTRLRQAVLERVSFRFESVQHYSESINELLSSVRASLLARRREHHEQEAVILANLIEEGQKSGEFSKEEGAYESAFIIINATNSFLPFGLSSEELSNRDEIETKASSVINLLIKGLSKKEH